MPIGFGRYLQSIGYKRYGYEIGKKERVELSDKAFISTMNNVYFSYYKDANDINENPIFIGLNLKDKPITLIWPRPDGIETADDDEMNRYMQIHPHEELYEAIKHKLIKNDQMV